MVSELLDFPPPVEVDDKEQDDDEYEKDCDGGSDDVYNKVVTRLFGGYIVRRQRR